VNEKSKIIRRFIILLCLLLAVAAVIASAEYFFYRQRFGAIGELDSRYAEEHGRAAETIGRLTAELERERELNRELRKNNLRARAIAGGLAETTQRNVRNLQDAIGLIGEIRAKLKVLADFYANSDTGNGTD